MKCKETKALISYLADIFAKLNVLNKELQGKQKTLIDCKTKIFAAFLKIPNFEKKLHSILPS